MIRFWGILAAACLALAWSPALAASPAGERVNQRLLQLLPSDARWGLAVKELGSDTLLLTVGEADAGLVPGSLVKLLVSGAALEAASQGKPPQLTTELCATGYRAQAGQVGNLYLRGSGNVFLSPADLQTMVDSLQAAGITNVTGNVQADGSLFELSGFARQRNGAAYAAPGALGLDLHTVALTMTPGKPGTALAVTIEPANEAVRFAVAARTVESGLNSLQVQRSHDTAYRISGDLPQQAGPQRYRLSLDNPARYAAQSLTTLLRQKGIRVRGEATEGITPQGALLLSRIPGPELQRYLSEMNNHSLNVAADNLLLALGGARFGYPASRATGLQALNDHLRRMGLNTADLRVADGSGLLSANRITADALVSYLARAAQQPWFEALYSSLPRAGMDGTLRGGSFVDQRFRAKSGNLENVTALAGYGVDQRGRRLAFVVLVNSDRPLPPVSHRIGDE